MGSRSSTDRADHNSGGRRPRHEEAENVIKPPGRARFGRLAPVELPDFGSPATRPDLPPELYRERLARLRERAEAAGYGRLVLYADREHSANLAWLTGFDPRFEEAIAIVGPTDDPAILVGNEDWGTAGAAPLPMRRHLFQDLSLPSQPRDRSRPLREILADEGLRVLNEVDQLAAFEAAACRTSDGVRRLIHGLRPGMTEREAVALLGWDGSPLSCHLMLTAGPRA